MTQRILSSSAFALLLFCLVSMQASTTHQTSNLDDLNWILHTWERTNVRPGTTAFEIWQRESDQLFTGIGVSMKGSDTTFVEHLSIELKAGEVYYVADVKQNATPIYFLMTEISEKGFKSENPEHDFPKAINYMVENDDLTAVISDGGDKKMGFIFKRKR